MLRALVLVPLLALVACNGPVPPRPDGGTPGKDAGGADAGPGDAGTDAGAPPSPRTGPAVILMIGDGMGPGQLDAASRFRHGETGKLFLQNLAHKGRLETGSLSGITDSAAAATTMATGVKTYNARIGLDREGKPAQTLVELAHQRGLRAGIVSSALLPHATPGAFSAHRLERADYVEIADDQARTVRPDVMLGGGWRFFRPMGPDSARSDSGLLDTLRGAGFTLVSTASELSAVRPNATTKLFGAFAPEHLDYVKDRGPGNTQPSLTALSLAALQTLDASEAGFFLMIEGARIDMASHLNDVDRTIGETLDFDDAVAAVAQWAQGRQGVTLVVTADHECGGLQTPATGKGVLPTATWRWGNHTNVDVGVFGQGPGTEAFDGKRVDHRLVHALLLSQLTGAGMQQPGKVLVPDGDLSELKHQAVLQAVTPSGFGAGLNQLDALKVDADAFGLELGVQGLFEWDKNALIVLIDVDFGAGTGPAKLQGALTDVTGKADALLSALNLDAPMSGGFGADLALVSFGGADAREEDLLEVAGLRGLRPPYGQPNNLAWIKVSTNFGQDVRVRAARAAVPGEGYEAFIPWSALYPSLAGKVPPNALVAVAVVLVNDDGGYTSNQALPPFLANAANPGRTLTRLPGVLRIPVDSNGDGVGDSDAAPTSLP